MSNLNNPSVDPNDYDEVWASIEGWDRYEVSSHGRVRSLTRVITGADGVARTHPGRTMTITVDPNGYSRVKLSDLDGQENARVHQLVARAFLGRKPKWATLVMHLDDNPGNNFYKNLSWGTTKSNTKDRDSKERQARGITSGMSKLTETQVLKIRKLYAGGGRTQQEIGDLFGITPVNVSCIVRRRTWKHIEGSL